MISSAREKFEAAMDNDLNIADALAAVFDFVKDINKLIADSKVGDENAAEIEAFMLRLNNVLGVLEKEEEKIPDKIKELAEKREKARRAKDYKTADSARDELKKKGYIIEDTPNGPRVKRI